MNQLVLMLKELAFGGRKTNLLCLKRSEEALRSLCDEIESAKVDVKVERLHTLLRDITVAEHLKLACDTLAKSGSLMLMEQAVSMNPNLSKQCADYVMMTARARLMTTADVHDALEAQSLLEYAHAWYRDAGALTAELDTEIEQGLERTAWANK